MGRVRGEDWVRQRHHQLHDGAGQREIEQENVNGLQQLEAGRLSGRHSHHRRRHACDCASACAFGSADSDGEDHAFWRQVWRRSHESKPIRLATNQFHGLVRVRGGTTFGRYSTFEEREELAFLFHQQQLVRDGGVIWFGFEIKPKTIFISLKISKTNKLAKIKKKITTTRRRCYMKLKILLPSPWFRWNARFLLKFLQSWLSLEVGRDRNVVVRFVNELDLIKLIVFVLLRFQMSCG